MSPAKKIQLAAAGLGFAAALISGPAIAQDTTAKAIFAGGCFWCVEADFDKVEGVTSTVSGYIGGSNDNPTYQNHGSGGHLEAVEITYDTTRTDFETLVDIFWRTIDPTDDGGQFCDRGNSYTTAVFALDEEQAEIAEQSRREAEEALGQDIVTDIRMADTFWPAEDYHQNYYQTNPVRYSYYRRACGRNDRLEDLWGDQALAGVAKS